MREFQRLMLLEKRIIDCCEERYQISQSSENLDSKSKTRRERRIDELHLEMRNLWREYRKLVRLEPLKNF